MRCPFKPPRQSGEFDQNTAEIEQEDVEGAQVHLNLSKPVWWSFRRRRCLSQEPFRASRGNGLARKEISYCYLTTRLSHAAPFAALAATAW